MLEGEAPVLILDEEDLWRLPDLLDARVLNCPEARRYGYVKVRLRDGLEGQGTKLKNFLAAYPPAKHVTSLKKSTLQSSARDSSRGSLFLVDQDSAIPSDVLKFREQIQKEPQETCCMEAYNAGGVKGYLDHLQEYLCTVSGTAPRSSGKQKCSGRRQYRVPKKRWDDMLAVPLQDRGAAVEMCMGAETLETSSASSESKCKCPSCTNREMVVQRRGIEGIYYFANVPVEQPIQLTTNYKMAYTTFCSMLSEVSEYFLGVSCPAADVGTTHSLFNFHYEDMSLWSFNFVHEGAPKAWTIIPPEHLRDVNNLFARGGMGGNHRDCSLRLSHKSHFVLPQLLQENKIPHSVVIQKEGEGVIVLPNAVHGGANMGPNLAEAMNIATKGWLPYGCVSEACTCNGPPVHVDLTTILKKEGLDSLLTAYAAGTATYYLRDDSYFQQSILHPACLGVTSASSTAESSRSRRKRSKKEEELSVKCPECSFQNPINQKQNMEGSSETGSSCQMPLRHRQDFL